MDSIDKFMEPSALVNYDAKELVVVNNIYYYIYRERIDNPLHRLGRHSYVIYWGTAQNGKLVTVKLTLWGARFYLWRLGKMQKSRWWN